jgi:hypothetical protein
MGMRRTRDTRRHGSQRKQARSKSALSARAERTARHPLFGEIPLVSKSRTDAAGREHHGYDYDPSYRPAMPKGAVRGNVTRQHFCPMCHVPRYFYVDLERICVQCGVRFVFSGAEQKLWYETLQFHFRSVATRCPVCRRKRRYEKQVQQQLIQATADAQAHPDNPIIQVALAEAIVRLFERRNEGSLQRAIAACRKARRLRGDHSRRVDGEAMFWEAKAQALAGRTAAALDLFQRVLAVGMLRRRNAHLAREARSWLDAHAAG